MENSLFKDREGNYSSKRVFGAIIILFCLIVTSLDGLDFYTLNETIVITFMGIGSTLLGLETITNIWRK